MGILLMYRNLLSKSKFKLPCISHSSSSINLCFYRRIFSEAGAHDPSTAVGDMNPKNTKPMFLIHHLHEGNSNYSLLSVADENKHHRICSPFSGSSARCDFVSSCKEWILFSSNTNDYENMLFGMGRLTLWNPTTNRIKTLPPPLLPLRPRSFSRIYKICFGFGFEPKSQDYKIMEILQHDNLYGCDTNEEVHVELYSLKTDSWKQITVPPDVQSNSFCYNDSVHINGVNYWASSENFRYSANDNFIRSFDFADEKFSEIPLPGPPSMLKGMRRNYCFAEFHESPAIIVPYWVPIEDLTDEEHQQHLQNPFTIRIWVWNGETWNLGPRCAVADFPVGVYEIRRLLGLFQNEYLFFQGYNDVGLMLFNCKTGKLENLGIQYAQSVFQYTVPI